MEWKEENIVLVEAVSVFASILVLLLERKIILNEYFVGML